MNAHKREEYKRKLAEKDQEIAGLKAKLIEVDAIINSWHQSIIGTTEAFVRLSQVNDEDCSTSLQEHDRQVILDAVDSVQKKTSATVVLSMVREYANSLTNGDDNG